MKSSWRHTMSGQFQGSQEDILSFFICLPQASLKSQFRFSLLLKDSDIFENQNLLSNLIGTLVKPNLTGRIEPYLASGWQVSEDEKKWIFPIPEGLADSFGDPITAQRFVAQLTNRLKWISDSLGVVVFDKLVGWAEYTSAQAKTIRGLFHQDSSVVFQFSTPPQDLLEVLRMVYFGFWPENHPHGVSLDEFSKFAFSGSFEIESVENNSQILLRRRGSSLSKSENGFDRVLVGVCSIDEVPDRLGVLVRIGSSLGQVPADFSHLSAFTTAPTVLTAAILAADNEESVFFDSKIRARFAAGIRAHLSAEVPQRAAYYFARGFYANSSRSWTYSEVGGEDSPHRVSDMIRVALPDNLNAQMGEALRNSISIVASQMGLKSEFEVVDRSQPDWRVQLTSNQHYDLRISSVDTGATFIENAIQMMFCTQLGVSFPDPGDQVCRLLQAGGPSAMEDRSLRLEIAQKFEEIVNSQSAVVPLFHSGVLWLQSADLESLNESLGTNHPRLDLIRRSR